MNDWADIKAAQIFHEAREGIVPEEKVVELIAIRLRLIYHEGQTDGLRRAAEVTKS